MRNVNGKGQHHDHNFKLHLSHNFDWRFSGLATTIDADHNVITEVQYCRNHKQLYY